MVLSSAAETRGAGSSSENRQRSRDVTATYLPSTFPFGAPAPRRLRKELTRGALYRPQNFNCSRYRRVLSFISVNRPRF